MRTRSWIPHRTRKAVIAFVAGALVATPLAVLGSHGFDDVAESAFYHDDVAALVDAGITQGCSIDPPLFCPNNPLTRGQMAAFLNRLGSLDGSTPPSVDAATLDGQSVDDFAAATHGHTRTQRITIPAEAFTPTRDVLFRKGHFSGGAWLESADPNDALVAPIPIPDGVRITRITVLFYDVEKEMTLQAFLYRNRFSDGGGLDQVALLHSDVVVTPSGFTAPTQLLDHMTGGGYYVEVKVFNGGLDDMWNGDTMRIHNVGIEYEEEI